MVVYKCLKCGEVMMALGGSGGELVCDNEKMQQIAPNKVDASKEKHVPVISEENDGYLVEIGSEPHPMLPEHHIEWISLIIDGVVHLKYLVPGDEPIWKFKVEKGALVEAYAFCNLHGLWKS